MLRALMMLGLLTYPAMAEGVLVLPQTTADAKRKEFYIVTEYPMDVRSAVTGYGFSLAAAQILGRAYESGVGSHVLPIGSKLLFLLGPATDGSTVPHRISVFTPDEGGRMWHRATIAVSDTGEYVPAVAPHSLAYPAAPVGDRENRFSAVDYWFIWERGHSEE